ncbi:MAG: pseudouridine-5'-phosphate glycosidase [Alphaproteobacteria bacterium]
MRRFSTPELVISPEVVVALNTGGPVVALESTIITHGMPYPANAETATALEDIIRMRGGNPATIALLSGKIHIGLTENQLDQLAQSKNAMKVSRRDIGYAMAAGRDGGTTVAATMICAAKAGIRVFATGGIGGVHRGWEQTLDISADMEELGRTPVAVISAGAKSILDLPATLEVLESRGVPVIGYGTSEFPAFHTRTSGLELEMRANTADQLAKILSGHWGLGLRTGALIANPIPKDDEIPADEVEEWIDAATHAAKRKGISGKDVTPFMLGWLAEGTDGRALAANQALIKNNAALAADLAKALTKR